jgi:hypothetical protein
MGNITVRLDEGDSVADCSVVHIEEGGAGHIGEEAPGADSPETDLPRPAGA